MSEIDGVGTRRGMGEVDMWSRAIGAGVAIALLAGSALAQDKAADKVKIGLITTLSRPAAVIGQQQRDGLKLALKELGNKLGERDVELLIQDDEVKPDVAVSGNGKGHAEFDR
jgi:branched-chain amino acid transport system substrate-binding protein